MKHLLSLLLIVIAAIVHAQSTNTATNCFSKMTKKELIVNTFNLECENLKRNVIANYKIKVPRYKTVAVKSDKLNARAISHISKALIGDFIVLFDIRLKSGEYYSPISITIIK